MGSADVKSKLARLKLDRYECTGETPATDRAKRIARRKAHVAACKPFQDRLNPYHAAWVAAGMPADFPRLDEWEASRAASKTGAE